MTKLILAAIIAIAPLIILIIRRMPTSDEARRKDIAKYEDELEEIRTAMAKALSDGFVAEYHLLNVKRQQLCKKLSRLRRGLKTNSPD